MESTPKNGNKSNGGENRFGRHPLALLGWVIAGSMAAILAVLIPVDFLFHQANPYNSLITYLILPAFLVFGLSLRLLAWLLEMRSRSREGPIRALPVLDLNEASQLRRVKLLAIGVSLFLTFSAVGTYRAYQFTESPVFCGVVCHEVMEPNYVAALHSPHAKVSCTECHIGPGADSYIRSKMKGIGQLWAMMTDSYELPIRNAAERMRPARETCETCHWAGRHYVDSVEKDIWRFAADENNTPTRYSLLFKVGGDSEELGVIGGIHWHNSPGVTVRYWSRNADRSEIPWMEVSRNGEPPVVYRTPDCPDPLPPDAEIRVMDCTDCHNRPAHQFRSPGNLVDFHLANGSLDRSMPGLAGIAKELMARDWLDTDSAIAAIADEMNAQYESWARDRDSQESLDRAVERVQTLYRRNFFPEQGADWRQYPNHLGHFEFPGCFRCHDDKHVNSSGKAVSNDCRLCHEVLSYAEGEAADGPKIYGQGSFEHPRGLGTIWEKISCTKCHGIKVTGGVMPD